LSQELQHPGGSVGAASNISGGAAAAAANLHINLSAQLPLDDADVGENVNLPAGAFPPGLQISQAPPDAGPLVAPDPMEEDDELPPIDTDEL